MNGAGEFAYLGASERVARRMRELGREHARLVLAERRRKQALRHHAFREPPRWQIAAHRRWQVRIDALMMHGQVGPSLRALMVERVLDEADRISAWAGPGWLEVWARVTPTHPSPDGLLDLLPEASA